MSSSSSTSDSKMMVASTDTDSKKMNILCRICEQTVPHLKFQCHNDLCLEINAYDLEMKNCDDELKELRSVLENYCDEIYNEFLELIEVALLLRSPMEDTFKEEEEMNDFLITLKKSTEVSVGESSNIPINSALSTGELQEEDENSVDSSGKLKMIENALKQLIREKLQFYYKIKDIQEEYEQTLIDSKTSSEMDSDEESIDSRNKEDNFLSINGPNITFQASSTEQVFSSNQNIDSDPSTALKLKSTPNISAIMTSETPSKKFLSSIPIADSPSSSPGSVFFSKESFLLRDKNSSRQRSFSVSSSSSINSPNRAPSIRDYEIMKPLSKGAYGSVFLSRKRVTGDYYAIKVLKKSDMINKNQVMNVKAEKLILGLVDSPFVVKLFFSFQSKDYLYLVMEYLNGGDCLGLLKNVNTLDEDWAKTYVAELILALEYLHERGVFHRDLKPDNMLIDKKGHIKLTDFGLSKVRFNMKNPSSVSSSKVSLKNSVKESGILNVSSYEYYDPSPSSSSPIRPRTPSGFVGPNMSLNSPLLSPSISLQQQAVSNSPFQLQDDVRKPNNSFSRRSSVVSVASSLTGQEKGDDFVGTPDYLAPECLLGQRQDASVDVWAVGVILYEFLYGYPPFHADTPVEVFDNILSHNLTFNDDEVVISDEARDVIEKLLNPDVTKRLGCGNDGINEIKSHPFFKNINWETLPYEDAPFIPKTNETEDTKYFDSRGLEIKDNPKLAFFNDEDYDDSAESVSSSGRSRASSMIKSKSSVFPHSPLQEEFGSFVYKNLALLEKANIEVVKKMNSEGIKTSKDSVNRSTDSIVSSIGKSRHRSVPPSTRKITQTTSATENRSSPTRSTSKGSLKSYNNRRRNSLPNSSTSEFSKYSTSLSGNEGSFSRDSSNLKKFDVSNQSIKDEMEDDISALSFEETSKRSGMLKSPSSPYEILVIDDSPVSTRLISRMLDRSFGCHCTLINNNMEALKTVLGKKFDLVLFDVQDSKNFGEMVTKAFKNGSVFNKDIPIIAVTSLEQEFNKEDVSHFDEVLCKPISKEMLKRLMEIYLYKTNETI